MIKIIIVVKVKKKHLTRNRTISLGGLTARVGEQPWTNTAAVARATLALFVIATDVWYIYVRRIVCSKVRHWAINRRRLFAPWKFYNTSCHWGGHLRIWFDQRLLFVTSKSQLYKGIGGNNV